ncbi:unnamed protein product [Malus baccata var. baccata]
MAGSGGGELRAPVFNGENFDFWQIRMKTIFRSHELWNIVEQGFTTSAKGEGELTEVEKKVRSENLVKDARALGIIQGAVSDQIFPRIATLETAKEAWDILKQEYVGEKQVRSVKLQGLRRDFEYTRMSESESLAAYLARLFDLINQMRSYGEDLSNQRIVQKLLISLPKTYDSIASVIENTKDIDVIDAQDVVAILKGKFGNQHTNTGGSKYQKNFKFKGKQWTNRFTPGVRNEVNNTGGACKYCDKLHYGECWLKGKIKCHKCGKPGHIARICNQSKNAQQGNFANKVGEQRSFTHKMGEPGNLFMVKQSTEVKAELLVEIDRSIKAKVQVGTGVLVDVKGKGTLVIDTDKGKRYIREVMLVPGITENLLSVGQMTEHGYFLVFGDYKVDIFDDRTLTNKVVSVMQKGNRCFPLVFKSNDHLVLKTNVHQSSTMWHKRFGHLNYRSLQQLQEHDMVLGLPEMHDSEGVCQGCALGKNHRESFQRSQCGEQECH